MKLLSERLNWAMKEKSARDGVDVLPADIARAGGVSATSASFWLNDANGMSAGKARLVGSYLDVNPLWLETGQGSPLTVAEKSTVAGRTKLADEVEILQYVGVGGSMGNGLVLRDLPGEIQSWRVTSEWIRKNVPNHTGVGNLAIVTGFGPSMRPLFNPGDPILVDRGVNAPDRDAIYFFRVGDEGFIKHLQRVPGVGLVAISENKIYRDWTITQDMDFEVLALVIKVWCGTDF
jgi:phage repressor protein C with HTH and peptisase S24 domain